MVYYDQQTVALLAQISQQLSSLAPQVSIPSTPPPPYPAFNPSSSDVRINAYWFMSLIFSLCAALLATLVQQWVRDYMHVFQRYSHPLKSARIRQYLCEGVEGWYMPVVAEFVPGLVHVSLFLFFLGLGDSLLNLNTTVGITTIVPITLCGFLYIFSTFAPVIYPQSPYQNSFSALIWYLTQKVHARRYVDRASGGARKPVSSNMARGQMQLAMEESEARKGRDVRSIQWLVNNLTEDIEMESFVLVIPGSFSTEWGIEVWKKVLEIKENETTNYSPSEAAMRSHTNSNLRTPTLHHVSPSRPIGIPRNVFGPVRRLITIRNTNTSAGEVDGLISISQAPGVQHSNGDFSVHELYERVRHLFETCNDRGLFATEDAWRRRARGCVETAASLVCCANAEVRVFGDIGILLNGLGGVKEICESSIGGSDQSFVTRWTCLSLLVTRGMLDKDLHVLRERSGNAVKALSQLRIEGVAIIDDGDEDEDALKNARRIDERFNAAKAFCVNQLNLALCTPEADRTEEQTRDILRGYKFRISELERIQTEADLMEEIDWSISVVDFTIRSLTSGLILRLPGVNFDEFLRFVPSPPDQLFICPGADMGGGHGPIAPQWIFLRQRLRCLGSFGPKLRDFVEGRRDTADYEAMLKHLKSIWDAANENASIANVRHLMERQLWRLRDLRDGGGFGFTIELFFLSLRQLLSTSSSSPSASNSTFFVGTFNAITADWRQHKHSLGTQRVLLNLTCDLAADQRGLFSDYPYPSYITDELLELLGKVLEGQMGSHIDDAMEELKDVWSWVYGEEDDNFPEKAWRVIARTRTPVSSSP